MNMKFFDPEEDEVMDQLQVEKIDKKSDGLASMLAKQLINEEVADAQEE